MKIKTYEKLQDLIDQDLAWRKKELINLKLLIHSTKNPTLCRAGIALLSAHFEGFIKLVANYYIVYISNQNINLSDLKSNFVAIHSGKLFKTCGESKKVSVYQTAIDSFLQNYNEKQFKIKYTTENPIIKTESNPSSEVVKNIFDSVGLDFTPFETKKNYIDADLLKNRHSIVHGEKLFISINDFDNTYKIIFEIMEQFSEQILNAAFSKEYLKPIH